MKKLLKNTIAAAALTIAGSASAVTVYTLNDSDIFPSGNNNYGTVTLDESFGDVTFSIQLSSELDFRQNTNKTVFSFNGTDVSLTDIVLGDGWGKISSTSAAPFGTFQFGITALSDRNGGFTRADPLNFRVTGASISDFLSLSTLPPGDTRAYFAADVACIAVAGNCTTVGVTGNVGAVAPIPEPETYALMLAGLGVVGFMARRRRQQQA